MGADEEGEAGGDRTGDMVVVRKQGWMLHRAELVQDIENYCVNANRLNALPLFPLRPMTSIVLLALNKIPQSIEFYR